MSRDIFKNARKIKNKAYPRKDAAGRLITEYSCLPFILSSMGGLCKEGHEFLKICKKKDPFATLRMVDVLVTQHSKWTAKRVRRALFGQSLVDFDADPWVGVDNQEKSSCNKKAVKKKSQNKQSRLEKSFSQVESSFSSQVESSQATTTADSTPLATTVADSTPLTIVESESTQEDAPSGTVYFSNDPQFQNVSYFQNFSGFQRQNFPHSFQQSHFLNEQATQEQDPHFQYSSRDPHFRNEQYHFPIYPQEQCFQAFSREPDV